MSIREDYIQSDMMLYVEVGVADLSSFSSMEQAFVDLDEALDRVELNLHRGDIANFLIGIRVAGAEPKPGLVTPYEPDHEPLVANNPWNAFSMDFWVAACANPILRQRVREYLVRLNETLATAENKGRTTASLWEDDETQFGEPLISNLAMHDIEFVPYYIMLLRRWDMYHEVNMGGVVLDLVKTYGIRAETRELIVCYVEQEGSYDVQPMLLELLEAAEA